jgi:hypothetical protein
LTAVAPVVSFLSSFLDDMWLQVEPLSGRAHKIYDPFTQKNLLGHRAIITRLRPADWTCSREYEDGQPGST